VNTPLRVLILEDRESDALLMLAELRRAGYAPQARRVDSEPAFLAALDDAPELVLSDYHVPGCDVLRALALLVPRAPDVPFILVTGTIDDEDAVAAMREGASDYVLKDRMARLGPAVQHALARKHAERTLRASDERLRDLFDHAHDLIQSVGPDGRFEYVSRSWQDALGYTAEEARAMSAFDVIAPAAHEHCRTVLERARVGDTVLVEAPFVTRDGREILVEGRVNCRVGAAGEPLATRGFFRDVTESRRATRALAESRERLALATEAAHIGVWDWDVVSDRFTWDARMYAIYGLSPEYFGGNARAWLDRVHPDDRAGAQAVGTRALAGDGVYECEFRIVRPDGEIRDIESHARVQRGIDGKPERMTGVNLDVTARRRAERFLRESESRYRLMFDANPQPIWVFHRQTLAFLAVNDAAIAHYGYSRAQFLAMTIERIRPPAELPALHAQLEGRLGGDARPRTWRHSRRDGSLIDVEIAARPIEFDGQPAKLVLVNDVTARVAQERRLAQLTRMRAVLTAVSSSLLRLHERDSILEAACRIAVEVGGLSFAMARVIDPATGAAQRVASFGRGAGRLDGVEISNTPDSPHAQRPGSRALRERRIAVSNDAATDPSLAPYARELCEAGVGAVAACPLVVEDRVEAVVVLCAEAAGYFDAHEVALLEVLTADLCFALDRAAKTRKLEYLRNYDALTGLPNQSLFQERLAQYLERAASRSQQVCVIALDLARFTLVNEQYGRAVGDTVLRLVGARLSDELEAPLCLTHVGGDTFALARICDNEAAQTAFRLGVHAVLERPFAVHGHTIALTAQAGVAAYPNDGEDAQSVFRNAEAALKQARAAGERDHYYSRESHARATERLALEAELRAAVDAGQFELHYQPKVDLAGGELVGAEALLRWQHPRRGLLAPATFIALAEETGLIAPIGEWVIRAACEQQAAWAAAHLRVVPVSVNLSPIQLRHGSVLHVVQDAIRRHAIDPKWLELELTESAVMEDPTTAAETLRKVRALGVGLALDDFGTGFSSLAHLKRFPFCSVKIDRSFVNEITRAPDDAAIASAIIAMAHRLGLKVVAEGIETEAQLAHLRAQGCDEMQGNYYSPAVDATTFAALLYAPPRLALPATTPVGQQTILVVDDEPGIRAAINRLLRRDGYRVLLAESGPAALDLLALNAVQVIISDQRMAPMSGTEFLSIASRLYPRTQRIILSGYTDLAVVTEAVNRGAVFRFLTKPWDDVELRTQVREALQRFREGTAG
jgi:diguanylate cyclase (GGDEF)-like protein/PAS domain S-box-containing protein